MKRHISSSTTGNMIQIHFWLFIQHELQNRGEDSTPRHTPGLMLVKQMCTPEM